jgi:hypothetical protein
MDRQMNTAVKRTSLLWTLTAAGLGTIIACSGQTLDAGSNGRDGSGGSCGSCAGPFDNGGNPPSLWPQPPSHSYSEGCEPSVTPEFNGTWRGTFDDYSLPSGSRSVRVVVEGATASGICGYITFGDADPPPLPTDREAPYAPGFDGKGSDQVPLDRSQTLVDGFVYQFGTGKWVPLDDPASNIQYATINLRQPYKAWCEIQYSYRLGLDSLGLDEYSCLPRYTSLEANSIDDCKLDGVAVSCTQVHLCIVMPLCWCNLLGCTATPHESADFPNPEPRSAVRIEFAGDSASGIMPLPKRVQAFTMTRSPE